MREKILIVEDDPTLLRGLKDNFDFEGYRVSTAADGEKGIELALSDPPDLVVLDLMLPRVNGYEVCRSLRERGVDIPILMLTAKGEETDIVLGFKIGADDYVTKPFSVKELLARVEALLRRVRKGGRSLFHFGSFALDLESHLLSSEGKEVSLTPKEYGLLEYLVQREGRALTRDEILDAVWGEDVFVTQRSVDRCVTTLRNKIEVDPKKPEFIQTVRQFGYRFVGTEQDARSGGLSP